MSNPLNKLDWRALVRSVAPTLGAALGGPVGGVATKFLAEQFLGAPDASERQVAAAIHGASPQDLLRLKELDLEFQRQMAALEIDVFRLEAADRQGARELFRVNIWPQVVLSALFVGCYFTVIALMVTGQVRFDEGIRDMLLMLVGLLTREVPTIMQFWFGSSFGSKVKDARAAPGEGGAS